ncbi:MAG: DUF6129 family protein [Pseudomonadota bacterium]
MIINQELVSTVARMAADKSIDDLLKQELKRHFPGVRFTLCSEDDIHAGSPVYSCDAFEIYLVGSSDSCLTLTNDFSLATGVVIAEVLADE